MAPEILDRVPYQGNVVDLFALGVILFIMKSGGPPFNEASENDRYYNLLSTNRPDLFWKKVSQTKAAGFFSPEF